MIHVGNRGGEARGTPQVFFPLIMTVSVHSLSIILNQKFIIYTNDPFYLRFDRDRNLYIANSAIPACNLSVLS